MKKTVLITGVFGGIGYATAKVFHQNGWKVIGVDRKKSEDKENVIDLYIEQDLCKPEQVNYIFDKIAVNYGRLDCLVNNAAIQVCKSIIETTEEEWDSVFATNMKSIFLTVKNSYNLLRETRGAIVNISSVHAIATSKDISAYAASKGAILAFTRATALEFSDVGIRVNAVLPGAIDTQMLREGLSRDHGIGGDIHERIENLGLKHPSKKIGDPEEIGKTIYFLADNNQSSFITGQALIADGGALAQLSTET
ncbi:SDR family NAD(P)-dependent oxidoreductase [Clostridium sp. BSD9I1]|uniref:SDR family NAD(P)-dependent oxidoreductase n=1 Tax=Clostridium sp. BSD9I1 TaxID=2003589 RepID=UPI0016486310|nr:SDR family oxidoreductase [Clostridium sp. BSD9I1]